MAIVIIIICFLFTFKAFFRLFAFVALSLWHWNREICANASHTSYVIRLSIVIH